MTTRSQWMGIHTDIDQPLYITADYHYTVIRNGR
jgi:hypothetical protein